MLCRLNVRAALHSSVGSLVFAVDKSSRECTMLILIIYPISKCNANLFSITCFRASLFFIYSKYTLLVEMSKMKRKAIVFDLVDNKRKVPRGDGVKYDTRNHSSSEDDEQSNWVSYLQPEILNLPYMLDLLEQVSY